ncbi:MAG: FHA domain-containing protein, partial [Anaerolineales bacterium]
MEDPQNETLFLKRTQVKVSWPNGETQQFPLDKENTVIGREGTCDILVPEDFSSISRRHAEIRRSGSEYELVDLASVNGVLLNGEPVNQHVLSDGDEIEIGLADMGQLVKITFLKGNEGIFHLSSSA